MKGVGGSIMRLGGTDAMKARLARKLMPLEDVSPKYSATAMVQLSLPLNGNLSIPATTERLREAYSGRLSEVEVAVLQPIMVNTISAIKYAMHSGEDYALLAISSKILSPFLWDVLVLWLRSCQYHVVEDIREVVLVEDAQNQGATRVKVMFGAKIYWGGVGSDQVNNTHT